MNAQQPGGLSRGGPSSRPIVIVLESHLERSDIPFLCRRLESLLDDDEVSVVCEVEALGDPDLVAVDALARLQLTARRAGANIRILHAGERLRELVDVCGLSRVLALEVGRKAEERKEPLGIEKERDS